MQRTFDHDAELTAISLSTDLHALEQIVEKGKRTFVEVGAALLRIREGRLYRLTHSSWETYCQQRWGWGRGRANNLIAASTAAASVSDVVRTRAMSESSARELAKVPEERRAEVLDLLPGAPTAATIRETAEELDLLPPQQKRKSVQTRRTPRWFFDALNESFGPFQLDAYASPENALCERFYTKDDDANSRAWCDVTFANPPFEKMAPVLAQAVAQAEEQEIRSVVLAPIGCSQRWFHELAIRGTVFVPDCRINFDDADGQPTGAGCDEPGADRDTIVIAFGGRHGNLAMARRGRFRAQRLEVAHLRPGSTS